MHGSHSSKSQKVDIICKKVHQEYFIQIPIAYVPYLLGSICNVSYNVSVYSRTLVPRWKMQNTMPSNHRMTIGQFFLFALSSMHGIERTVSSQAPVWDSRVKHPWLFCQCMGGMTPQGCRVCKNFCLPSPVAKCDNSSESEGASPAVVTTHQLRLQLPVCLKVNPLPRPRLLSKGAGAGTMAGPGTGTLNY